MTHGMAQGGPPHEGGSLPDRLDEVARENDQTRGFTPRLIACRARILAQFLAPGEVLDLGCSDGLLTEHLARRHRRVVAVDVSKVRLERTRERCHGVSQDRVELRRSLFEEFEPQLGERFDGVVLSCVLEHVAKPAALLARAGSWLRPGGKVVVIVPNAGSLHRRAGVILGHLEKLTDLGAADEALDHERVYTLDTLRRELRRAGLTVGTVGGYLIKPVPNDRMAELPPELVDAYEELGHGFPELAAEIYAVGGPPEPSLS